MNGRAGDFGDLPRAAAVVLEADGAIGVARPAADRFVQRRP